MLCGWGLRSQPGEKSIITGQSWSTKNNLIDFSIKIQLIGLYTLIKKNEKKVGSFPVASNDWFKFSIHSQWIFQNPKAGNGWIFYSWFYHLSFPLRIDQKYTWHHYDSMWDFVLLHFTLTHSGKQRWSTLFSTLCENSAYDFLHIGKTVMSISKCHEVNCFSDCFGYHRLLFLYLYTIRIMFQWEQVHLLHVIVSGGLRVTHVSINVIGGRSVLKILSVTNTFFFFQICGCL